MADEKKGPKRVHKKNDESRTIEIDISLTKINKDWLFITEKGDVRLKMKFIESAAGSLSKYDQIGFLKQQVPTHVWKAEKEANAERVKKGEAELDPSADIILGNAEELDWKASSGVEESRPVTEGEAKEVMDKLPF